MIAETSIRGTEIAESAVADGGSITAVTMIAVSGRTEDEPLTEGGFIAAPMEMSGTSLCVSARTTGGSIAALTAITGTSM